METIRKSKSLSSDGDPIKSLTASQLKGSKSSTTVQKEKKPLTSKIQVGWLHKPAKAAKFCQMKGVFGGVRSVTLERDKKYFVADITQMIANTFTEGDTDSLIKNSTLAISSFQGEMITSFDTKEGQKGHFWAWHRSQGKIPSRSAIYLFTTAKSEPTPGARFRSRWASETE